jgi:hypothetical protein
VRDEKNHRSTRSFVNSDDMAQVISVKSPPRHMQPGLQLKDCWGKAVQGRDLFGQDGFNAGGEIDIAYVLDKPYNAGEVMGINIDRAWDEM